MAENSRDQAPRGGVPATGGRRVVPREAARQIESWIRIRGLGAESRLPAEREFAIKLGIGRPALREGLKILETRGIIEVRPGVGAFAATDLPSAGKRTIAVSLRLEVARLPTEEILVARRTVECAIVGVAAENRDDFDLEELSDVLAAGANAEVKRDTAKFVDVDLQFHELIGQCTHNLILREIQSEITRSTAAVRDVASMTHDAMRAGLKFHGLILDAIAKGDGEVAAAVMLLHLVDVSDRALSALLGEVNASGGVEGVP